MDDAQNIILDFLKASPASTFTRKEIARKAVHRTEYEENPRWADSALHALIARGDVEVTEGGLIHLKPSNL